MHGHKLCWQYTIACLQKPENTYSQSFQRHSPKRKMLYGLVLRFQIAFDLQWKGELLNFMITPGDVDDRKPLEYKAFIEFIYGKLFGDKGYISKNLFQRLFVDGIQLITKFVRCQTKVHTCECSYLLWYFLVLLSKILLLIEFCFITSIPQHYSLWGTFIHWSEILGIYPLTWGFSGVLGSCIIIKSPIQTNGEVW